jgi:glyoxalase family protein
MQKLQSQAVHHITIFTDEGREPDPSRTPTDPGCVHHVAFALPKGPYS